MTDLGGDDGFAAAARRSPPPHRLMMPDQVEGGIIDVRYDYIVIGSGAGGAAAAWRLAQTGRRILVLEKGDELPADG
ncbi:MAG: FAD-dependent oxidoreductase, partial [Geminicoccaceae bacterium]